MAIPETGRPLTRPLKRNGMPLCVAIERNFETSNNDLPIMSLKSNSARRPPFGPFDQVAQDLPKIKPVKKNPLYSICFRDLSCPTVVGVRTQELGAVSKLSFGPISAWGVRFQSSKYFSIPPVETHKK